MLLTGVASRSNQESVRSIMRAKPAVVNGAPPFRREPRGTILRVMQLDPRPKSAISRAPTYVGKAIQHQLGRQN